MSPASASPTLSPPQAQLKALASAVVEGACPVKAAHGQDVCLLSASGMEALKAFAAQGHKTLSTTQ